MADDDIIIRHLEREKRARIEAENIGERKIAELDQLNESLQKSLDKYKRLSAELEKQKEKTEAEAHRVNDLNNIIESSIEYSIISLDLDGTILSWNTGAKNNYGYDEHEAIGENYAILHTPQDAQSNRHLQFLQAALMHGSAEDQFMRVRKNGQRFLASVNVNIRRDSAGNAIGYLLISRDITEQIRLKELDDQNRLIREADRLKSQFIANMSHELRTPLNSIIGFSELMRDGELGPVNPEQHSALDDVLSSAKDLLQLISDLLDISKIESGKIEFAPQTVHLPVLVKEITDSLSPLYNKKHIQLTTAIAPEIVNVYLDPMRLKQVLYNYLSNAIKFTPDQGTIDLHILPEQDDFFRIEVEDSGIGINPDDLSKLYVEFQQLHSNLSRKYKGTGLGLSVTKNIVEAQGGQVGVTSTPGKGSIFFAVLPKHYHNGRMK